MCNGSKKCKTCNSIKIGSTMATKRRRSTKFTVSSEDLIYAGAGAVGSMLLNKGVSIAIGSMAEGKTKEMVKKGVPALKLIAAGYMATQKKQSRMVRMMSLGGAASSALELAVQVAPEGYFAIAGTGNLYLDQIGAAGDPMLRLTADSSVAYDAGSLAVSGVGMMEPAELSLQ